MPCDFISSLCLFSPLILENHLANGFKIWQGGFLRILCTLTFASLDSSHSSFVISRGAEGPGREILQRPPPPIHLSVCLSVRPSVCPSPLVFAL